MERLSPVKSLLGLVGAFLLVGCASDPAISAEEEARFRNPQKGDVASIPPDAFKPKGPAFVGEPSTASKPSGQPLPKAAAGL